MASNVKRQNCYYYIKQTLKKPNQPKVKKPKNNYQTNCTLSLSLKNNTRPKKFTNRLTVPEGFYNIHTNFQAPPPHANFAHTLKENRAVKKKMSKIPPLCSFKLLFGLKRLLNVKNNQFTKNTPIVNSLVKKRNTNCHSLVVLFVLPSIHKAK